METGCKVGGRCQRRGKGSYSGAEEKKAIEGQRGAESEERSFRGSPQEKFGVRREHIRGSNQLRLLEGGEEMAFITGLPLLTSPLRRTVTSHSSQTELLLLPEVPSESWSPPFWFTAVPVFQWLDKTLESYLTPRSYPDPIYQDAVSI